MPAAACVIELTFLDGRKKLQGAGRDAAASTTASNRTATDAVLRCAPCPNRLRMAAGRMLMVSISECFSESYAEARPKFCSAAADAGGALRSWFNPKARGPNGEALYLDTARFGAGRRPQHAGADRRHAWRRGPLRLGRRRSPGWRPAAPAKLPKDTGASDRHAINPYGFAWTRRVTEDNVDLNRNFVDHDKAYPKNDGYLAIADADPAAGLERGRARPRPSACSPPTPRSTAPSACRAPSAAASTPIPTASSSAATRRPGATARSAPSPARNWRARVASASSTSTPASARSATAS